MLIADPLHEAEPESDAPTDGALGRPSTAGLDRGQNAAARLDRIGSTIDAGVIGERLADVVVPLAHRPPWTTDPFGRRLVGAPIDVDREDGDSVPFRVVDEDLDRIEAHRLGIDQPDHELGRVEQLQE